MEARRRQTYQRREKKRSSAEVMMAVRSFCDLYVCAPERSAFMVRYNEVLAERPRLGQRSGSHAVLVGVLLGLTSRIGRALPWGAPCERGVERNGRLLAALHMATGEIAAGFDGEKAVRAESGRVLGKAVAWHLENASVQVWANKVVDKALLQCGRIGIQTAVVVASAAASCAEVVSAGSSGLVERRVLELVTRGPTGKEVLRQLWLNRSLHLPFATERQWTWLIAECASAAASNGHDGADGKALRLRQRSQGVAGGAGGRRWARGGVSARQECREFDVGLISMATARGVDESCGLRLVEMALAALRASAKDAGNDTLCCKDVCIPRLLTEVAFSFPLGHGTRMHTIMAGAVDDYHVVRGCRGLRQGCAGWGRARESVMLGRSPAQCNSVMSLTVRRLRAMNVMIGAMDRATALKHPHAAQARGLLDVMTPWLPQAALHCANPWGPPSQPHSVLDTDSDTDAEAEAESDNETDLVWARVDAVATARNLAMLTAHPFAWDVPPGFQASLDEAFRTSPDAWPKIVLEIPMCAERMVSLGWMTRRVQWRLLRAAARALSFGGTCRATSDDDERLRQNTLVLQLRQMCGKTSYTVQHSPDTKVVWATATVLGLLRTAMSWGQVVQWLCCIASGSDDGDALFIIFNPDVLPVVRGLSPKEAAVACLNVLEIMLECPELPQLALEGRYAGTWARCGARPKIDDACADLGPRCADLLRREAGMARVAVQQGLRERWHLGHGFSAAIGAFIMANERSKSTGIPKLPLELTWFIIDFVAHT